MEDVYDILGLLKLRATYNESKYNDRLRLNKAYVKYVFTSDVLTRRDSGEPVPLVVMKTWHATELRRCDKPLGFMQPDAEALVECLPLETHLQQEDAGCANPSTVEDDPRSSSSLSQSVPYVKRRIVRNKVKQFTFSEGYQKTRNDLLLYPLKSQVVEATIDQVARENNLPNGLGFSKNQINMGHYFEFNTSNPGNEATPVTCYGKMFLSVNASKPYSHIPDGIPDFYDHFGHIVAQSLNGFMIHLKDVTCARYEDPSDNLPLDPLKFVSDAIGYKFRMDNEFTLIRRSEFPYWTCKHVCKVPKLMGVEILDYLGTIVQTKDDPNASAYNTTISIQSDSEWHRWAKYRLEQSFFNDGTGGGFEEMILSHAYLAAIVKGDWSLESFSKKLKLFHMDRANYELVREFGTNKLTPAAEVSYRNKQDETFVTFQFKFQKNFFAIFEAIGRESQDAGYTKPTASQIIETLRREDAEAEEKAEQLRKAHEEL